MDRTFTYADRTPIANQKPRRGSLDAASEAGYSSPFMVRALVSLLLLGFLSGCASDQSTLEVTPERFVKIFSEGQGASTVSEAGDTNSTSAANLQPRIIGPGMVLGISVEEDRSLSHDYGVLPSGAIDFTPLGRINVVGLKPDEVAQIIKQGLEKDYFQSATVKVSVESTQGGGPGVIYVIGRVNRPGPLLLPKDERFTVTKAIIAAGNLDTFGNGGKVQLIRYDGTGKKYKTYINVDRIMKRGEFEKDIPLQAGDWIIVPEKIVNF
jgi:polysaccharide export outer membrane protein